MKAIEVLELAIKADGCTGLKMIGAIIATVVREDLEKMDVSQLRQALDHIEKNLAGCLKCKKAAKVSIEHLIKLTTKSVL